MKKYKVAVDENILIKDEICSAGSKMLYNFKSPYSATAVDRLRAAGMKIVQAKTGEFGNETDTGSAASMVADGFADCAIGIDVDGAAYSSAVKNNVLYIQPSYGTVSRFGVVANVSSLDRIGVYAKTFEDGFEILSLISGYDKNDGTSYPAEKYNYEPENIDAKSITSHIFDEFAADYDADIKTLSGVKSTSFGLTEYIVQVYYIISAAEFSNNISRFDGLKFGYRTENFKNFNDMVINSRSESFTAETKIKALMGTYVLSEKQYQKYYHKAMQVRRLIKEKLDTLLSKTSFVILPVSTNTTETPKKYYEKLKCSALSNLTGTPSVIIPTGRGKGIQIIAKGFNENKLFALGKIIYERGQK